MRLYGNVIAIVSGGYSSYLSTADTAMNTSSWFMLALGLVVIAHGVLLLTPLASWLKAGSGIAMIVNSVKGRGCTCPECPVTEKMSLR